MAHSKIFGLAFVLALAPGLMAFSNREAWDHLEGEWAYGSTSSCESNVVSFSNDYKRDRRGNLVYPPSGGSEPRRDRLATVLTNGEEGRRVAVGERFNVEDGSVLHLRVRRHASSPFRGWSQMYLTMIDDDTLQLLSGSGPNNSDGDGTWLLAEMGSAPATLVRCPLVE